jgi:hypothetical protein
MTGVDFLAQNIDVRLAKDGRSVVLTLAIGNTTCSVALPRDRLQVLHDQISRILAETVPTAP